MLNYVKNLRTIFFSLFVLCLSLGCSKTESPQPTVTKNTRLSITKVTISAFPATAPNGTAWDNSLAGNFPDVYFKFSVAGAATILHNNGTASRIENVKQTDLPIAWNFPVASPYPIDNLSQGIDVEIWDYDSVLADDAIGFSRFLFTNYTTGTDAYPTKITTTNAGVTVTLDVIWRP